MRPEREIQLTQLASNRQADVHVILENVQDPHNVGAVMRTCDAVGVPEVHMTMLHGFKKSRLRMGKHTSAGARKWVETYLHEDIKSCLERIDTKGAQIIGTALAEDSVSLYDIDFSKPSIFIFGNENHGLSDAALESTDIRMTIPQKGMVQSLNISVACAVTLYEMMRQRLVAGMYGREKLTISQQRLLEHYFEHHNKAHPGQVHIFDKD